MRGHEMRNGRGPGRLARRRPSGWVGSGLAIAILAALLVIVPVDVRAAKAAPLVVGSTSGSGLPEVCEGDTLDASHLGGGDAPSHFGVAWVAPGQSVNFKVSGEILPSTYVGSGRGEYLFYVRVIDPDTSTALWEEWNFAATGIESAPYSWVPFSEKNVGTWTNSTGAAKRFIIETWARRSYAGAGVRWSVKLTVSAGTAVPCDRLPTENDVPNVAEPNSCGSQPNAADPVNVVQGNFWQTWSDIVVPGRGAALNLARTYSSSRSATDGPLGFGWAFSYGMSLTESAGVVQVRQENGAVAPFFEVKPSVWVAPARANATLVEDPGSSSARWVMTRGGTEIFRFDSAGKLASISDLSGNVTSLGYAGTQLSTVTDPSGRQLAFTWTDGRITKVTSPSTVLRVGGTSAPMEVSFGYTSGDLTSVTETDGGVWTFTYASHRLSTIREPRHQPAGPVVENSYDPTSGKVTWQDDALGRRTTFAYTSTQTTVTDPANHVVVYEHSDGICTGIIRDPGPNQSKWSFEVDKATLARTKTTDPNGIVTTATFNGRGLPTSITTPKGTTTIVYDSTTMRPASITDPSGVTTSYSYAPGTNRLTGMSRPISPGGGTWTMSLVYGDATNPGRPTSVTDSRGEVWSFGYSNQGDLTSSTDPSGKVTTWFYNSHGWPLSTVAPEGNAAGGVATDHTTTYEYDAAGTVVKVTEPLGAVTEYSPDLSGFIQWVKDPVDVGQPEEKTTLSWNAAGELVQVTRPDLSMLATTYWPDGSLKSQTDGASKTTSYAYDAQGRPSSITDPAGRVTTFGFDPGGRVRTRQLTGGDCSASPKLSCVSYEYFDSGELKKVDYSDATPDVTFGYNALGQRTSMVDGTGMSTWEWDSIGRLLSATDSSGTVSYGYLDAGAGATSITYPGGKVVTQSFDDAGRLLSAGGWVGGAATFGYDDNSNLTTIDTGATASTEDTFGFDPSDRVTAFTLRRSATSTPISVVFGRNADGAVNGTTGSGVPALPESFGYNSLDQLASHDGGAFSFDGSDNLTGFPDGREQRFDAGNELCYQATTNTAPCATPPALATTFAHDSRGSRTRRTSSGQATFNHTGVEQTWVVPSGVTSITVEMAGAEGGTGWGATSGIPGRGQRMQATVTVTPGETLLIGVGGKGGAGSAAAPGVGGFYQATGGTAGIVGGGGGGGGMSYLKRGGPADANRILVAAGGGGVANGQNGSPAVSSYLTEATPALPATVPGGGNSGGNGGGWVGGNNGAADNAVGDNGEGMAHSTQTTAVTATGGSQAGNGYLTITWTPTTASDTYSWDLEQRLTQSTSFNPGTPGSTAFSYTGAEQAWTVPARVTTITVDMAGGDGGADSATNPNSHHALGGRLRATLTATPGEILLLGVGQSGADSPGMTTPGGAAFYGGTGGRTGLAASAGGGGGQSYIKRGGDSDSDRVLVAAGGGGEGTSGNPGSPSHGGAVLDNESTAPSAAGAPTASGAGGSGGGWRGGGTQATSGLNGAGGTNMAHSAQTNNVTSTAAYQLGNGYISVTWTPAAGVDTTSYTYSGDGLRRTKTSPDGTVTTYTWDRARGLPLLLAEAINSPGTTEDRTIRYLYDPTGLVLADITTPGSGAPETIRWYHHDQLGSTIALTDNDGTVIGTYAYTPFGELAASTGTATTAMGWAGEYRDKETGLTYLRARYYDPSTGVFLTRDPLSAVTRDAYGYAANNPVNYTDPTGLFVHEDIGGALASGAEAVREAVQDTGEFVYRNRGTIATVGAAGACLVPGWGLAACGYAAAGAFGVRAEQRVDEQGFSNSLRANLLDGGLTYLTFGVGGAFDELVGPWAGFVRYGNTVGALPRANWSYLGRLIPAGYDVTNLFGWLDEQC